MADLTAEERGRVLLAEIYRLYAAPAVALPLVIQALRDVEAAQRERDAKIAEGASEGYGSNTARMVSDEIARSIRQG